MSMNKIPKSKIPKMTHQLIVTVTDDGDDGTGGIAYLTRQQIKEMITDAARPSYAGIKIHVDAMQEIPPASFQQRGKV